MLPSTKDIFVLKLDYLEFLVHNYEYSKKSPKICTMNKMSKISQARAIFKEGCKAVAAGMNPMDLRRGI